MTVEKRKEIRDNYTTEGNIVHLFDDDVKGINGAKERRVFNQLPKMKREISDSLCRLTMMQVLPAIIEQDCSEFGAAITEIQNIIGDYFSDAQGGRYTSPFLKSILKTISKEGATGLGQSSWGPTGFVIFPNETIAFQALKKVRLIFLHADLLLLVFVILALY